MEDTRARTRAERWAVTVPLLTPALMVYYLCCWPGDANSESSSEKGRGGSRPGAGAGASGARHGSVSRRASDLFHRKVASSVVSLHLPSTSGHKKEPLCAHRSHEEIRRHVRGIRGEPGGPGGGHEGDPTSRYHSAPSVIDEVLHRRDWERSSRDLHIPLRSPGAGSGSAAGSGSGHVSSRSESVVSPPGGAGDTGGAPRADPETSSIEEPQTDEQIVRTCKKHYTNIKSSKRKENDLDEDKDRDATEHPEPSTFYIGDNDTNITHCVPSAPPPVPSPKVFQAKEAKQTFNESIRRSDRPCPRPRPTLALVPLEEHLPRVLGFSLDDVIDRLDRSGATHHTIESRISLSKPPHPPPSVEAVGYEGGACYLAAAPGGGGGAALAQGGGGGARARHASDGDILAPGHACRPESGAFSESDLDLEVDVEPPEDVPPPYEELQHFASPKKKETAI